MLLCHVLTYNASAAATMELQPPEPSGFSTLARSRSRITRFSIGYHPRSPLIQMEIESLGRGKDDLFQWL